MNEKQARALAAAKGVTVGKRITVGTVSTIQVGDSVLHYDSSKGGCGCWQLSNYVFGADSEYHAGKPRKGLGGEMLAIAVEREVPSQQQS